MEANEAPEKVYLATNEKGTYYYTEGIPFEREYIEYVCKDTFIERAAKWLDDNIWAYVEIMHPTVDSYTRINRERLIWDFKKVMRR